MELKAKLLKWSAGIPVAMLNEKTALKTGVHTQERISIKVPGKVAHMFTIIDIVGEEIVKENEIGVSSEIMERLSLKEGELVEIVLMQSPKSLEYIKNKLSKKKYSRKQLFEIIKDIVNNSLSEAEIALFVSANYNIGLTFGETLNLIKAILRYSNSLSWKEQKIFDKHSIGGVAGNRTTPIIVSICATCGLTIPKSSSRAITSAAGTADVIETLAKVDFTTKQVKRIVKNTGACMVWGGSLGMVPADSRIIRIEKALKIDPKSQLLASIISKKLAVGSNHILIDIPFGKNAKVTKLQARELKKDFLKLAKFFNLKMEVVLTNGNQPIGTGIGPNLEMIDVLNVLDPKKTGPLDLEKKSLFLSGKLLELSGIVKKGQGVNLATSILYSGLAFEKFKEIITSQEGKIKELSRAKFRKNFFSRNSGKITEIKNKEINDLARIVGCPIDKSSGISLFFHVGDRVKKREKLLTIYSGSKYRLRNAFKFFEEKKPIKIS